MRDMLVLAVNSVAKAEAEERVRDEFRTLQAASQQEPGCLLYVVQQAIDDPRRFLVYEQYRDQAALDEHRASEHFQRHAPRIAELCASQERTLYHPI